MKQTLEWLSKVQTEDTYVRGLRANVWAMLGRKSKYYGNLKADVKWLLDNMQLRGAHDYHPHPKPPPGADPKKAEGRYDNSNSQIAVLGIWAGAMNGVEVPLLGWQRIERHWFEDQAEDGGWNYHKGGKTPSYGSMTAAGLATVFVCFDALHRAEFVRCGPDRPYLPIVRGLAWMDKHFSAVENPNHGSKHYHYYLYGVERVGLASGYKYFGNKDWYKLGAKALIDSQRPQGNWGSPVETSFALLFLARGQHPVLFNKLQYDGGWNARPRDLANLTRWISQTFESPLNWQIINLRAPVREMHDAPIMYISGTTRPNFSKEDLAKLREFVLQGGVILSEAACDRGEFSQGMQRYYAEMFPQYELKRLEDDHPIYNLHFQIGGRRLMGLSNGVRLLAIHSPTDLSRALQLDQHATDKATFELAANVYFFVTDKESLRHRGVSLWPREPSASGRETLKVAIARYGGNFQPEPLAWRRFAILMNRRHGVDVKVSEPTDLTAVDVAAWPVMAMTGTNRFELSAPERAALTKYLADGGTLIVDAAGGSAAFAAAAGQLDSLLPGERLAPLGPDHPIYTKVGPTIDKVQFRRALATAPGTKSQPRLRGLTHGGRSAVIFSGEDLTAGLLGYPCWGLKGYAPETAFQLMRNVVLYASGKMIAE